MNLVQLYLQRDNVQWIHDNIMSYDWANKTVIPWTPTTQQERVLRDKSQYRLAACGRRVGKTDIIAVDSIGNAIRNEQVECLIVVPYSNQASVVMSQIRDKIEISPNIRKELLKVDKQNITFKNGSMIKVRHYGRIEDVNLNSCNFLYIDEFFYMNVSIRSVLQHVMTFRPQVKIIVLGTPNVSLERNDIDERFNIHRLPATECPLITTQMIDDYREQMPESVFIREILAQLY